MADYNGGYKFTYLDYLQTVSLFYSNMQLSNNFSVGSSLLTVLFLYQFARFITGDISDSLTVLLLGTITGLNVFSTFLEPAKFSVNGDDSQSAFYFVDAIVGLILGMTVSGIIIRTILDIQVVSTKPVLVLRTISLF